ncbi:MAG: WXG100 family type VII secretion target [Kineosporiaceae bacterium]|nr:WXG100 family type VII secretion target [Kineosporiaceae bacterium]MBK7623664.1 WXG100 family type VII secretion target [Kineosporiaceae bacterium]MBK8078010.1 WXG100 family type VII secretion target [Kineosporiaceae bacterium]
MPNIHVDYAELSSTASRLTSGQSELEGLLRQLHSVVQNLVASGFVTDRASRSFDESYAQWTKGATDVIGGLSGMSQFLNKAIADHQSLDAQLSTGA